LPPALTNSASKISEIYFLGLKARN